MKSFYPKECPSTLWLPLFKELAHPPERIWWVGKPDALSLFEKIPERGLAIVGTRSPQPRCLTLLKDCLMSLRNSSLIIISGLALGIDAEAHHCALESGLATIAFLGNGLENPYPPKNITLAKRIIESGGLLLSEFSPEKPPLPHHFLIRNRLIAASAQATWVVQAGFRSGALNTAKNARELHRTCFATPGFPEDPSLSGNQILLDRDHALPFWGAHSLGAQWLELSSIKQQIKHKKYAPQVLQWISQQSQIHGGVSIHEIARWALSQGIKHEKIFSILEKSQHMRLLTKKNGLWISCQNKSKKNDFGPHF